MLDTLVNNAGLMLLGPVVGADAQEWDRMIAINVQGLLSTTRAALPHLLQAAKEGPRRVADIVNISSIAADLPGRPQRPGKLNARSPKPEITDASVSRDKTRGAPGGPA
jgi:NADP-dependent 3-hydroxy acid dehydrogenase YdfG